MSSTKPVIFISYSHKDEPETPRGEEVAWLSFVRNYLQPAVKGGIIELWDDRHLEGGADWDPEIEQKLNDCDIFILLVSAHSMASNYIVDREIQTIRDRQARGEDVHFYPLLLTPTPKAGLDKVTDKNLRPRDARPFSGFAMHDRMLHMTNAADEIAKIATRIGARKSAAAPVVNRRQPAYVHITGLPETPYERLVGRDDQLQELDEAWSGRRPNILSLIAEGGAGKSALVNEWLKRMQADDYRGAEMVLGWSFYSQGTKERATSADEFLNWTLEKLGVAVAVQNATTKAEAIAEALISRRALLVLDGVEPLQFGPEGDLGRLKDEGLRILMKRFAATPSGQARGLIVLTSRLAIADIASRRGGTAPVLDVEDLTGEAGAALLRDNGVWGTDKELEQAALDFGGHPLALGLLASFLEETQSGDVRRRDHIRGLLADSKNPGHDHAARVMESYEKEWLSKDPVLRAVMFIMGLFDRPADERCLGALRQEPVIAGLTEDMVALDDVAWRRAIARLRDVRLLVPADPSEPGAIDAHPLVREWFGSRLKQANEKAWKDAHGRIYEHLRDTVAEGEQPSLMQLTPLYQAIAHGCRADRHEEALYEIYRNRICRRTPNGRIVFYSSHVLGAHSSNLSVISWFFQEPYETPVGALRQSDQSWVLNGAAIYLRAMGRLSEALPAMRAGLRMDEAANDWVNAAIQANALSETALLAGSLSEAIEVAETSVAHGDRSGSDLSMMSNRTILADALFAAGRSDEAKRLFEDAERRQYERQPQLPRLYSGWGYLYCNFLLSRNQYAAVYDRALDTIKIAQRGNWSLIVAFDTLSMSRALFGLMVAGKTASLCEAAGTARAGFDKAVDGLRAAGSTHHLPSGLLARARFRSYIGDRDGASRDLDEVAEIAGLGSMKLYLCDLALERARLAFAQIEAFAPLNGMIDNSPPKPMVPSAGRIEELRQEAATQIKIAADYISSCGYHRRDEELAELQDVLDGKRKFADLPIRV